MNHCLLSSLISLHFQKAEVFLPRSSGLGRELVSRKIRQRKLQTSAGKRRKGSLICAAVVSSHTKKIKQFPFCLSCSGICCQKQRSTTSCLTSLKACWSMSRLKGSCWPTPSNILSLRTEVWARPRVARTGKAIETSAGDPRTSRDLDTDDHGLYVL